MPAKILFIYIFFITNVIFTQLHPINKNLAKKNDFSKIPIGDENVIPVDESKELEMIRLINDLRVSKGLKPLLIDHDLTRAARYHAADLAIEGYFKHHTYNRKKDRLIDELGTFNRIRLFYRNKGFANSENIAAGNTEAQSAFRQWVNSEGHLRNMLNMKTTHIGIGYYENENSEWGGYWVMDTSIYNN